MGKQTLLDLALFSQKNLRLSLFLQPQSLFESDKVGKTRYKNPSLLFCALGDDDTDTWRVDSQLVTLYMKGFVDAFDVYKIDSCTGISVFLLSSHLFRLPQPYAHGNARKLS